MASNLGSFEDCSGTAAGTAYAAIQGVISGVISGDVANNEASLLFYATNPAVDLNMKFHLSYQVIDP
ncbi:MAG: hypothetical protein DCC67_18740 [Planctomycetota bacterium]|nr:MAG: hypothetical protein DCC67_18740 [Planctomycetota bacterium]